MGKRFAIVIGVAAAGVMALGAQPAAAASDVVKYDSELGIWTERGYWPRSVNGWVESGVRKCERGRRVVLFKAHADRKVGTARTKSAGDWGVLRSSLKVQHDRVHRLYAKVRPKALDEVVCRADRSKPIRVFVAEGLQRAQTAAAAVDKFDTRLFITAERGHVYHGWVASDRDRKREYHPETAVRKCAGGRKVVLFKQRPGADRKLGITQSVADRKLGVSLSVIRRGDLWVSGVYLGHRGQGEWEVTSPPPRPHRGVYAKVRPKVGDGFVCRADRTPIYGGGGGVHGVWG